jgi:pyridoxine/pyridoxamine 5'-phosphate oxidase
MREEARPAAARRGGSGCAAWAAHERAAVRSRHRATDSRADVPLSYQFGEMPRYNGFAGYGPVNQVTIVIWSNRAVGLDGQQTAATLLNSVSDQVYELPPSAPAMPAPTTTR